VLEELSVSNLGIVRRATIELSTGLNVITGETGAGKTLIVEALGLLLGERAAAGLIGPFGESARVDGRFRPPPPALLFLEESGLDSGEEVVVSRVVPASGPSRAWVSGHPVTAGVLATLGELLVTVHGQHAHHRLLSPGAARDALDVLCAGDRSIYATAWERWREVVRTMDALGGSPEERAREIDLLRYQTSEIVHARLREGEDDELVETIDRLTHSQALREAALVAWEAMDGPASDAAGEAVRALRAAPGGSLASLAGDAATIQEQAAELARALRAASESFEEDPEALEDALARREILSGLRRKYGASMSDVLSFAKSAQVRLEELEGFETRAAELAKESAGAREDLERAATGLSRARRRAARQLAREVCARLPELALPSASVDVTVERAELGPSGADQVALLFAANEGAQPAPVHRVASGGELSRLMLALELCLFDPNVPSLVFDEVDTGVGGAAGAAVGLFLAELSRRTQVFCVTHLAQVASHARTHIVVRNEDGCGVVEALGDADRVGELSRMLAGQEGSAAARAHAVELLEAARVEARP
jgi:DNA repair protein RecN (Recombination protein N)